MLFTSFKGGEISCYLIHCFIPPPPPPLLYYLYFGFLGRVTIFSGSRGGKCVSYIVIGGGCGDGMICMVCMYG